MKKTLLYRWFGIGAIPKELRPALESEGIVVADEGMGGWFVTRDVKGPGRRYRYRMEGFSGSLAVTGKRVVCYTYGRCQLDLATDDPRIRDLRVDVPATDRFRIAFESSLFHDGWQGVIELRFRTLKAQQFLEALAGLGAGRPGAGGEG